jgi:ketosteroid isomerase-like protein
MSSQDVPNIHDLITTADAKFMAAYSQGDAGRIAELYSEHGQVLLPNNEVISGKLGIRIVWQGAMMMAKQISLETIEVEDHGDTAYEVGKYVLHNKGGHVFDQGKYIVIWKQEAGQWKLHRDIWNSSLPIPGQKPNLMSTILKWVSR